MALNMSSHMVLSLLLSVSMSLLNFRSDLENEANAPCCLHTTCCKIRYKCSSSCLLCLLVKNRESILRRALPLLCTHSVPGLGFLAQPIHAEHNSVLFPHLNYSSPRMVVAFVLIFDGMCWK